jgi:hypothetical protein
MDTTRRRFRLDLHILASVSNELALRKILLLFRRQ